MLWLPTPVLHLLMVVKRLALRLLVVVMREFEVLAARVDVHVAAQDGAGYG